MDLPVIIRHHFTKACESKELGSQPEGILKFELESEIERRRVLNSTQIGIGFWRRLAV